MNRTATAAPAASPSHSYYNEARDHDDDGSRRFDWRDCVGQYKLYYLVRSMHALAMLLCALNVVARIVAAAFIFELIVLFDEADGAVGVFRCEKRLVFAGEAFFGDGRVFVKG